MRADDKLVLIHEILTNRISLPGGTIIEGEQPRAAAQRETWEETGLVVTVGKELGRTETAVFFDCVSDSEIISYSMINSMGEMSYQFGLRHIMVSKLRQQCC